MRVALKNFIIPTAPERTKHTYVEPGVSAIIPTYKPGVMALRLVNDLLAYNPKLTVVVVDDSTPLSHVEGQQVLSQIRELPRVTLLHTSRNRLKAGALNLGLAYILGKKGPHAPAVVFTLDDDVVIGPQTVARMARELFSDPSLGAVCSRCSVLNKNKNLLTRLQGLEYLGYNAIRLSDQGFLYGPLVMHGMLTAFRVRALRQTGPFAEGHLIEDYEMTTRLKEHGWHVRGVLDAPAWTSVPERLGDLWRQRTRWIYGGVTVVLRTRTYIPVFQDVLGHGVFIATLSTIALLYLTTGEGGVPTLLVGCIVVLSLVQLISWYVVQLGMMVFYEERDTWDWILRVSLIPELIYSNMMTVALLGSYCYLGYSLLAARMSRFGTVWSRFAAAGHRAFGAVGYSGGWGTRNN